MPGSRCASSPSTPRSPPLTGEHDLFSKDDVRETIISARRWPNVIVDLTPCEFIDSTVRQLLIAAHRARRPGERFELVVPHNDGFANRVLSLIGIREFIPTRETQAQALASLDHPTARHSTLKITSTYRPEPRPRRTPPPGRCTAQETYA